MTGRNRFFSLRAATARIESIEELHKMIYTCFHAILFLNIKVYAPKFTERNKARNAHIPYDQAGIFLL